MKDISPCYKKSTLNMEGMLKRWSQGGGGEEGEAKSRRGGRKGEEGGLERWEEEELITIILGRTTR